MEVNNPGDDAMRGFASILLLGSLAGACGGGDDVPLSRLGVEMGEAVCSKMAECCTMAELEEELLGASNQQECEAFYAGFLGQLLVPVLEDSVAAGRLAYDAAAMRACLDAYLAVACAELRAAIATGPASACDAAFTGRVAEGDACASDVDCVSRLCAGDSMDFEGNVTMGVCARVPGDGDACVDGDCGAGLHCSSSVDGQTCAPTLADGAACRFDDDCTSGSCNEGADGAPSTCGASMTCDGV